MNIEKQTAGAVTILTFAGEVDAAGEPSLVKEVDALIEGSLQLVFNFRDLTFINSSGLGYLLKTAKALKDQGGELVFSEPAKSFRHIVEVYDVGEVFHLYANDQAAIDHFGEAGGTV